MNQIFDCIVGAATGRKVNTRRDVLNTVVTSVPLKHGGIQKLKRRVGMFSVTYALGLMLGYVFGGFSQRVAKSRVAKLTFLLSVGLLASASIDAKEFTWTGKTGLFYDVTIGVLEDPSVVQESDQANSWLIDYDFDNLEFDKYDIYIPADYDATKPFGLITFINSGQNGTVPQAYKRALDDKNIIWIGGDEIGNWEAEDKRRGVALAAIYRAMEVFNIDPDRVYVCGNSGGARVGSGLYWLHPELVKGMIANVGSSFLQDLPDMYINRKSTNYDEWYENYYISTGSNYIEEVATYDRPFAMLTGYADFREEYLLLIHHQGMKPYGFDSKVFSYDKSHSTANEQQFFDALSFIEHPRFLRVEDSFDNGNAGSNSGAGDGFYSFSQTGATVSESGGLLSLTPYGTAVASVASKTPLQWYGQYGAMMDFSFKTVPVAGVYNQKTSFGIWLEQDETFSQYRQPNHIQAGSLTSPQNTASLLFTIEQTSGSSKLIFEVNNAISSMSENKYQKVFEVDFSSAGDADLYPGWVANEAELDVRLHLMDTELIIEFNRHFDKGTFEGVPGARLLDDHLTIRVPWNEMAAGKKWNRGVDLADEVTNSWPTSKRCLFTMATEAFDLGGATPGTVEMSKMKIRDAGAVLPPFDFASYVAPDLSSSLEYSGLTFTESISDDGSVQNEIKITLIDDTWTGANGSSLLSSGKASLEGLPLGLTATLVKDHDTQATLRLSGNATAHEVSDSVSDMSLSFADSAFAGGDASGIAQSTRDDFGVQFLGAYLIVTNGLDSGSGSLREAVWQASDNTPIQFDPVVSSIYLTSGEILIDKSLTLDGGSGITINGGGYSRIFKVVDPANVLNVHFSGFTLENAKSTEDGEGGAIYNDGEILTIDRCVFNSNAVEYDGGASYGGAIWSKGYLVQGEWIGGVTLRNSSFTGNQAKHVAVVNDSEGGAIYHDGGTLIVEDCLFENNVAEALSSDTAAKKSGGGAISIKNNCTAVMTRVVIRGNLASSPGSVSGSKGTANGGAFLLDKSTLTLVDCTLDSNSAMSITGSGGAIYCGAIAANKTTSINLERCTLSYNSAISKKTARGGAIAVNTGTKHTLLLTLKNCTVSGNSAVSTTRLLAQGGAIYQNRSAGENGRGDITIHNTTFSGNEVRSINPSKGQGGALFLARGQMTLESVIVANNTATGVGKDIFMDAVNFEPLAVNYSLIESADGNHGLVNGLNNNLVGGDPVLGVLADNGGLTFTQALLPGSPAHDTGSNVLSLVNDQRGSGYSRVLNGQADMGAYEGVGESLSSWAADYGLTGGDENANADPDGDGMINLMEYFMGGNPLTAGFIKINPVLNENNLLGMSYDSSRVRVPNDVFVVLERSLDLGVTDPWVPVPATHSVSGSGPYTHTWVLNQASEGADREFIRMRVSSR